MEGPYKCFENSFWITGIFEQAKQDDVGVLLNGAGGNLFISWGPAIDYYAMLVRKFRLDHFYRELSSLVNMKIGDHVYYVLSVSLHFPLLESILFQELPDLPLLIHPDFA